MVCKTLLSKYCMGINVLKVHWEKHRFVIVNAVYDVALI